MVEETKVMAEITQNRVKELFDYRDGNLYWKVRKCQSVKIGDRAGSVRKDGYRAVIIDGKSYLAHRLIFLYHYGFLPKFLDHIDRNPRNNNISNLREATRQENGMNRKKNKSYNGKPTSSRFTGVLWNKRAKKWMSYIQINGKTKHLGYFASEIDAALAYDVAAIKQDDKFALTNAMMFPEIFKTKE